MFQNIKVDIIYFKTYTDFELEFNLCGCCRMRLLTDKAPDKKTLVHSLARAVSRSRVIIIAGKLLGDEGTIGLISHAIGKETAVIDKAQYGISGDDEIKVISGATPLVTPSGEFGGCIIESGPQSMILLTDDKAVRKTVMNTLIHPYIEELCATELKAKADAAVQAPIAPATPVTEEPVLSAEEPETEAENETVDILSSSEGIETVENANAEPVAETENETEETAPPIAENEKAEDSIPISAYSASPDNSVELYGGMVFEEDADVKREPYAVPDTSVDDGMYIEPQRMKKGATNYYNHRYGAESFDETVYRTDTGNNTKRPSVFYGNTAILITAIVLLVILAVLCYCIFYIPSKDGVSAAAYLRETFGTLLGKS